MSSTSRRTIDFSSVALSWILRSTMISSTISAIWWRSSSGPSAEATEMSMRCIRSGMTCCLTCISRLFFASGAILAPPSASGSSGASAPAAPRRRRSAAAAARSARAASTTSRRSWRCSARVGRASWPATSASSTSLAVSASSSGLALARPSAPSAWRSRSLAAERSIDSESWLAVSRPASNPSSMARYFLAPAPGEARLHLLGHAGELDAEPVQVGDQLVLGVGGDERLALHRRPGHHLRVVREGEADLAFHAGLELLERDVGLAGDLVGDDVDLGLAVADRHQLQQPVDVAQRLQRQLGDDDDVVEAAEQRRLAHDEVARQVHDRHVEVGADGVGEHQHLVVGQAHGVVEGLLGREHVQALAELRHRVLQEGLVDPLGVVERLAQAAGRLDVERERDVAGVDVHVDERGAPRQLLGHDEGGVDRERRDADAAAGADHADDAALGADAVAGLLEADEDRAELVGVDRLDQVVAGAGAHDPAEVVDVVDGAERHHLASRGG